MIYGYVRVSCDKQTTENQIFEIKKFAEKNQVKIDRWVKETISGTVDFHQRKLGVLLNKMHNGDIIIATELSRFGRNLFQVMSILSCCMENSISVWTIKDNYRLGPDLQSKIVAFAFSLAAEIEHHLISQRTREALARLRSEGKILGRPKGSRNKRLKLDPHREVIIMSLEKRIKRKYIARSLKVCPKTLRNFIAKMRYEASNFLSSEH